MARDGAQEPVCAHKNCFVSGYKKTKCILLEERFHVFYCYRHFKIFKRLFGRRSRLRWR